MPCMWHDSHNGLSQALAPLQAFLRELLTSMAGPIAAPSVLAAWVGGSQLRCPHQALMAAVAPGWQQEAGGSWCLAWLALGHWQDPDWARRSWWPQKPPLGPTPCSGARMGHPVPA